MAALREITSSTHYPVVQRERPKNKYPGLPELFAFVRLIRPKTVPMLLGSTSSKQSSSSMPISTQERIYAPFVTSSTYSFTVTSATSPRVGDISLEPLEQRTSINIRDFEKIMLGMLRLISSLNDQVKQLKGEIESNEETLGVTEDELNKTRNNYNEQRCMLLFLRAHQPKSVYLLLSSLSSRVNLDDPESVQKEIQRLEANVVDVDMSQATEAEQLISLGKELADEREISQFLRSQFQFKSKECSDQIKKLKEIETEEGDLAKDLEKIKKERWSKTAVFIVGVSFIALGAYWRRLSPPSLTSLVDRINERVSSFIEQHWQSIKPAIYSFSRDTQAHAENFRSKIIYALYKK